MPPNRRLHLTALRAAAETRHSVDTTPTPPAGLDPV